MTVVTADLGATFVWEERVTLLRLLGSRGDMYARFLSALTAGMAKRAQDPLTIATVEAQTRFHKQRGRIYEQVLLTVEVTEPAEVVRGRLDGDPRPWSEHDPGVFAVAVDEATVWRIVTAG